MLVVKIVMILIVVIVTVILRAFLAILVLIIVIAIPKPLNGLGSAPLLSHQSVQSLAMAECLAELQSRIRCNQSCGHHQAPQARRLGWGSWPGTRMLHAGHRHRQGWLSLIGLACAKDVSSAFAVQEVIQEMVAVQAAKKSGALRPIIFSLSNPMTQAEITAEDCYKFSNGKAIFGSGTRFDPVMVQGKTRVPGQVNNFFIFPGMSFGAVCCEAKEITDRLFMEAAEAVANSLDKEDMEADSVLPSTGRIREIGFNVAVKVAMAAQKAG